MAKRDPAADAWNAIAALRSETDPLVLATGLAKHLASKSGVVVGKATALLMERQSDVEPHVNLLAPALAAAFDRLMIDAVKSDPGCGGKIGVVNAGVALHCLEADLYLRAIHHVQMEGSFGPPVDTAEALRGAACYGLLNCRHGDAMYEIVELLSESDPRAPDRFPDSRRGAIRALGTVVSETSAMMLRLTAHRFAQDPDTLCEVFASLNSIEAGRSFDFIRSFLDAGDDISDIAALALAESKQPRACAVLLEHARLPRSENPQALFTAIAITRKPEAIEFLLDRLGNAREREALAALEALHLLRHDEALVRRAAKIVEGRGARALLETLATWK